MEYLILIALHVAFGIVWAGGAIVAGLFIIPSVLEAGPAGGAVMAGVVRRKMPIMLTVAATLVLLTGIRLYMIRFAPGWLMTPEGFALTLGALLGIAAFGMGVFIQKPTAERLGKLSAQIAASGAPPTAAQAQELADLRARFGRIARVVAWHLVGATLLMASHGVLAALGA